MKTAALYARFSSDLQKSRSIADQIALCEAFAKQANIQVIARYSDHAKSGASMFDREELMDLRAAAKRREFDIVISECLDRVSRDTEDLAGLFKRLTHYGVELRTVDEGVITDTHIGVRGITGPQFLKDLANKVKRGQSGLLREGLIPGGVTYGYDVVLGKPRERVINEAEANVVRRIFREYVDGTSPRAIAAGLTRDQIPSPGGGSTWPHQSLVTGGRRGGMLRNRLYIGEMVWNTQRRVRDPDRDGAKLQVRRPESEHQFVPLPKLRIIDQPLWEAAQAVRMGRSVAMFGPGQEVIRKRKPARNRDSLLSGLLSCGACGSHMIIAQQSRNGGGRVVCAQAHTHSRCDHRKSYDIGELERPVLMGLGKLLSDPELTEEAVKSYRERSRANEKKHSGERSAVQKQVNKLTLDIDRIVSVISDSEMPLSSMPVLSAKLRAKEAERAGLEERLRLLRSTVVAMHPDIAGRYKAKVARLHEALTAGSRGPAEKTAFRNLIDSVIVQPTGKCKPYEIDLYTRISAIMGDVDLFPKTRSAEEIVAAERLSPGTIPSTSGNRSPPCAPR